MAGHKIVILDGHTSNPDDFSWEPLNEFGRVEVYPRTPDDEVLARANGADILILNKIRMTREKIESLPDLKYIGLLATGFDNVDLKAACDHGVTVTNMPSYSTPSVAQHAFALLLQHTNRVALHDRSVHEDEWVRSKDFSYFKEPLSELAGKYFGIMGYGQIGQYTAKIARAFGMKLLVHSGHAASLEEGELVSLEELFRRSDVVSLHAALTPENTGIVNKELLNLMKPGALLINTSRGGLINEQDLADALNEGRIRGASLDVLSKEPPSPDNPLLSARNCIITPHISWVTVEARKRLMNTVVNNVKAYLQERPINVVS
jgi:glycerate dehydrogenase